MTKGVARDVRAIADAGYAFTNRTAAGAGRFLEVAAARLFHPLAGAIPVEFLRDGGARKRGA